MIRSAGWAVFFWLLAFAAQAENLRIAAFNVELTRRNPGLLVHDLMKGNDPQIAQVVGIIQAVRPDVLLLSGTDFDVQGVAISLLRQALKAENGIDYPYWFIAPVNTGLPSGHDLDGDGRLATASDAWGFGFFAGQEGMAVLSRYPIDIAATRTFQMFRWAELPDAALPVRYDGTPWPSADVQAAMRLSTVSHWDLSVNAPDGALHLLAANPTPPVFDGPEDANGRRNHDEIAFWVKYLEGSAFGDDQGRVAPMADAAFVVLGDFNADPVDGDGRHEAIAELLAFEGVTDPKPASKGAVAAAAAQAGVNAGQLGDPALDTADWEDMEEKPGNMRVDFVLPSTDFRVTDAGVFWPTPDDPLYWLIEPIEESGARHRLVWVDVSR